MVRYIRKDELYHYGRSKADGAPGVGTGNWRRGGSSGRYAAGVKVKKDEVSGELKSDLTVGDTKYKYVKPYEGYDVRAYETKMNRKNQKMPVEVSLTEDENDFKSKEEIQKADKIVKDVVNGKYDKKIIDEIENDPYIKYWAVRNDKDADPLYKNAKELFKDLNLELVDYQNPNYLRQEGYVTAIFANNSELSDPDRRDWLGGHGIWVTLYPGHPEYIELSIEG